MSLPRQRPLRMAAAAAPRLDPTLHCSVCRLSFASARYLQQHVRTSKKHRRQQRAGSGAARSLSNSHPLNVSTSPPPHTFDRREHPTSPIETLTETLTKGYDAQVHIDNHICEDAPVVNHHNEHGVQLSSTHSSDSIDDYEPTHGSHVSDGTCTEPMASNTEPSWTVTPGGSPQAAEACVPTTDPFGWISPTTDRAPAALKPTCISRRAPSMSRRGQRESKDRAGHGTGSRWRRRRSLREGANGKIPVALATPRAYATIAAPDALERQRLGAASGSRSEEIGSPDSSHVFNGRMGRGPPADSLELEGNGSSPTLAQGPVAHEGTTQLAFTSSNLPRSTPTRKRHRDTEAGNITVSIGPMRRNTACDILCDLFDSPNASCGWVARTLKGAGAESDDGEHWLAFDAWASEDNLFG